MKVNISVVGRFHAFDLAKTLEHHGILNRLITTYPKFIAKKWGLAKNKIVSEQLLELTNRYRKYIPFLNNHYINYHVKKIHAKNSSRYINDCDIHIGWSSSSLETIIESKKQGKLFILERGSSHYNFQMNTLQKLNPSFVPDYRAWQRELLEYELADYISIPSSFVKRTFIENGIDESKLLVNPYGVNLQEFKQIEKQDSTFRVIFTGNGSFRKGYHLLLQAFYELNLQNCELWHVGSVDKNMTPYLDKYKIDTFILKGVKPQNQLYKYYSQGSVFVMPSLEEGMAMVQFQAMACGLPLICSTNTGGDDLISKEGVEGFVIPTESIEAIKEKILFLYHNQDIAKEMGRKAKARVSKGFTWGDYGDRYVENLNEIIKPYN
ncbi:MAG: glycosyltransferase family 4 protein [Paraglaciecola sp.]|uniref:glycosyltransferase family 4 protein n=1 Tax=Paraglaciecola sp. TaxID=1920173 RepID=UPI00329A59F7